MVLTAGVAAFAAAYGLFTIDTPAVAVLVVPFVLAGAGIGAVETAQHPAVAVLAPKNLRGSAFGLLALQSLGNLAASAVAGPLWSAASPNIAFGCLTAWMLLALVGLPATARRCPPASPPLGCGARPPRRTQAGPRPRSPRSSPALRRRAPGRRSGGRAGGRRQADRHFRPPPPLSSTERSDSAPERTGDSSALWPPLPGQSHTVINLHSNKRSHGGTRKTSATVEPARTAARRRPRARSGHRPDAALRTRVGS
ncbi:hypothetical protein [Kitasatospora sp. McL0602]|uniref:hypothetical protein n=1 Tax=Kitasatospora sp. McL0602 TaxID=3439530 RepID=UPI003F8B1248